MSSTRVEGSARAARPQCAPLTSLREVVRHLEQSNDLVHDTRLTSLRYEVAAGIRATSRVDGPALFFDNVDGSDMPVVGGVYASRRRLLGMFAADDQTFLARFAQALDTPIGPEIVDPAPCQEVVHIGDDASFDMLPVCTYNELDPGPFITMGIQIARHPTYGYNACISRMQVLDSTTAILFSLPPQHLGVYFADFESGGNALPVAVALGNDPYVTLASQVQGSIFVDELAVAGGLLGEPIPVTRCRTLDLVVPATSEIVLEGEVLPGSRHVEGPFGEYSGYYGPASEQPIFKLRAVTHRENPVFLAGLTGEPTTDNHVLKQAVNEAVIMARLRGVFPTVRDLCLTTSSGCTTLIVSAKMTSPGQARDLMLTCMTTERYRPKLVIVVDDDVDPRDPAQVEWAVAFRVQADRDVVIIGGQKGVPLDPSSPEPGIGAVMGMDATRPFGKAFWATTRVPGADDFVIPASDG